MFTVLVALTLPFSGFNGYSAVLRSNYKKETDLSAYIFNALLIWVGSVAIVSTVYTLFSGIISKYSGFPESWLFYVVLVSASQFLMNLVLVIWQAKDEPIKYGIFRVLLTLLNIGTAIFLIVSMGLDWKGKIIGQITSFVIFGIIALFILWKRHLINFHVVKKYIKHILRYGLPLIPHVVSGVLLTMMDRIFITNMIGVSATGIYTVGYQIGMIIGVLATSFNKAWVPWLYKQLESEKGQIKRKIVQFTYLYIIGITI